MLKSKCSLKGPWAATNWMDPSLATGWLGQNKTKKKKKANMMSG